MSNESERIISLYAIFATSQRDAVLGIFSMPLVPLQWGLGVTQRNATQGKRVMPLDSD